MGAFNARVLTHRRVCEVHFPAMSFSCHSFLLGTGLWAFSSAGGGRCGFQNLRNLLRFPVTCYAFQCPLLHVSCLLQYVNLLAGSGFLRLLGICICWLLDVAARRRLLFLDAKSVVVSMNPLMLDHQGFGSFALVRRIVQVFLHFFYFLLAECQF